MSKRKEYSLYPSILQHALNTAITLGTFTLTTPTRREALSLRSTLYNMVNAATHEQLPISGYLRALTFSISTTPTSTTLTLSADGYSPIDSPLYDANPSLPRPPLYTPPSTTPQHPTPPITLPTTPTSAPNYPHEDATDIALRKLGYSTTSDTTNPDDDALNHAYEKQLR